MAIKMLNCEMVVKSLFFAVLANSFAGAFAAPFGNGTAPSAITYLGSVEGRSYFYDNDRRTWKAAKAFCEGSGMRLATITSATQARFLTSANDGNFRGGWVAGRDSHTHSQFAWDHDGSGVSSSAVPRLEVMHSPYEVWTCLTYSPGGGDEFGLLLGLSCTQDIECICEIIP